MRNVIIIIGLLLLAGCQSSSRVIVKDPLAAGIADTNQPMELHGKAADTMAEVLADNARTKQGRRSEMMKYNAFLYAGLVILMVAGAAFWGFTRSRYGFVIPMAAVVGIAFISFWSEYGHWITLGVMIITLSLLVWKVIEYQKERNAERRKQ